MTRLGLRESLGPLVAVASVPLCAMAWSNCAASTSGTDQGSGAAAGATGTGAGAAGAGTATGSGAGGAGTGASGATGAGGAAGGGAATGGGGATGAGGTAGGVPWPTCGDKPPDAPQKTIAQIWQDDPSPPAKVWVPAVIVTAVSRGACSPKQACQIFVQQDSTYPNLEAGKHQAIRFFVSAATAEHFLGTKVGDVVDVLAHAWRYTLDGSNEVLLQVNTKLPGCAKAVGTKTPVPIGNVKLDDLTVQAYEYDVGPLLVKVSGVSGKPGAQDETFALWTTGVFKDGSVEDIVSLSPFFLSEAKFVGLTPDQKTDFTSVAGVFGLFVPPVDAGPAKKYLEIYPRTMGDVVAKPQ
ncbi:MAG: hypothetical protein HY744_16865 [Deltaproteobacteria bacterium]|nr:hypothetical protein [Deltaproteobacteria bacterium]